MINKTILNISILSIIIIFISGCVTIKKSEYYPQDKEIQKKIIILYHQTKFRDKIINQLIEKLLAVNITVIIDDAAKSKNYDPDKFDLVVVFSGIHALIPDAYPNNYLFKHKKEKNIIKVFFTYMTKKGITIKSGIKDKIDTITAASITDNEDKLIENIFDLIISKL